MMQSLVLLGMPNLGDSRSGSAGPAGEDGLDGVHGAPEICGVPGPARDILFLDLLDLISGKPGHNGSAGVQG